MAPWTSTHHFARHPCDQRRDRVPDAHASGERCGAKRDNHPGEGPRSNGIGWESLIARDIVYIASLEAQLDPSVVVNLRHGR